MTILDDLAQLYASIGSRRVRALKLTRRALLEDKSPAATLVWHLSMATRHYAWVHDAPGLPVARLSPLDESEREWVDRAREIVAAFRQSTELRVRRRRDRAASRQG